MDIKYYMKIQNAYGTHSRREKELVRTNTQMEKHFEDTYDTDNVLINGIPSQLIIVKDTDGNTFKKKIKSCHNDKFNLGDYVVWNNQYWIVTLLDPDDKTWNRGYMYLCTILLRWQNSDGKIIERWGYSEDFTKYSNGTKGNNVITIGDNQYGVTLPVDSETKRIQRDMRFPIDFDDSEKPDIYKLTNRKTRLNNNLYFNRGATMILTLSYDAFDKTKDKYITLENGSQAWICDYHSPIQRPTPSETTSCKIEHEGDAILKCGGNAKKFTGLLLDGNGVNTNEIGTWRVLMVDEISQFVNYSIDNNTILISVSEDQNAIGGIVKLCYSNISQTNATYLDLKIKNIY